MDLYLCQPAYKAALTLFPRLQTLIDRVLACKLSRYNSQSAYVTKAIDCCLSRTNRSSRSSHDSGNSCFCTCLYTDCDTTPNCAVSKDTSVRFYVFVVGNGDIEEGKLFLL